MRRLSLRNACVSEEFQLASAFSDSIYDYELTVNHEAPASVRLNQDWAVNTGGTKVVTQLTDTSYSGPLQVTDVHLANFPANFSTATWRTNPYHFLTPLPHKMYMLAAPFL